MAQYDLNQSGKPLEAIHLDSNRARDSILKAAEDVLKKYQGDEAATQVLTCFKDIKSTTAEKNQAFLSLVKNYETYKDNTQIMRDICKSVGKVMHPESNSDQVALQIKTHMDEIVKILKTAWRIQPEESQSLQLRR